MADFAQAFNSGLEAAKSAERARKEIEFVFTELDQQVRKESNGKIGIDIRRRSQAFQEPDIIGNIQEMFRKDLIIAAYNPNIAESPVKILAYWDQDTAGYPCRISWPGKNISCEDRDAVENTLAELLRDPVVGEKLYALMQLEESTPEDALNEKPALADDKSAKQSDKPSHF